MTTAAAPTRSSAATTGPAAKNNEKRIKRIRASKLSCGGAMQCKRRRCRKELRRSWRKMRCRAGDRGEQCNPLLVQRCSGRRESSVRASPEVSRLPLHQTLLLRLRGPRLLLGLLLVVVPFFPLGQGLGPGVVLAGLPEPNVLGQLGVLGGGRRGAERGNPHVHVLRSQ